MTTWILVIILSSGTLKYEFTTEEACNNMRDKLVTEQTVDKIFCISEGFNSVRRHIR